MRRVQISDEAFNCSRRAAAVNGLTVSDYIETFIVHDSEKNQEGRNVTPEQSSKVCEGEDFEPNGSLLNSFAGKIHFGSDPLDVQRAMRAEWPD